MDDYISHEISCKIIFSTQPNDKLTLTADVALITQLLPFVSNYFTEKWDFAMKNSSLAIRKRKKNCANKNSLSNDQVPQNIAAHHYYRILLVTT